MVNVNSLNIIQLGLTLSDSKGNLPDLGTKSCYVWQFNFRDFDIRCDPHNVESVELLEKHGINFKKNREKGVDSRHFASLFLASRLVSNASLTWITFHGAYDIAFLIKILIQELLPGNVESFMKLVSDYLGVRIYDAKFMMSCIGGLYGGLEKTAKSLGVERIIGRCHQSGSDSLLTLQSFMKFKDGYANVRTEIFDGFEGMIYGLCERRLLYKPELVATCNGHGLYGPELDAASSDSEETVHEVEVETERSTFE